MFLPQTRFLLYLLNNAASGEEVGREATLFIYFRKDKTFERIRSQNILFQKDSNYSLCTSPRSWSRSGFTMAFPCQNWYMHYFLKGQKGTTNPKMVSLEAEFSPRGYRRALIWPRQPVTGLRQADWDALTVPPDESIRVAENSFQTLKASMSIVEMPTAICCAEKFPSNTLPGKDSRRAKCCFMAELRQRCSEVAGWRCQGRGKSRLSINAVAAFSPCAKGCQRDAEAQLRQIPHHRAAQLSCKG